MVGPRRCSALDHTYNLEPKTKSQITTLMPCLPTNFISLSSSKLAMTMRKMTLYICSYIWLYSTICCPFGICLPGFYLYRPIVYVICKYHFDFNFEEHLPGQYRGWGARPIWCWMKTLYLCTQKPKKEKKKRKENIIWSLYVIGDVKKHWCNVPDLVGLGSTMQWVLFRIFSPLLDQYVLHRHITSDRAVLSISPLISKYTLNDK